MAKQTKQSKPTQPTQPTRQSKQAKRSRRVANSERQRKLAALKAEQQRRTRRVNLAIGSVIVVVLIVMGMLVAKAVSGSHPASADEKPISPAVMTALNNVPQSVFDIVGVGTATSAPTKLTDAKPLSNGKPVMIYVGGEFCPFCAAERWPLALALMRFGSFSHLKQISSSASDSPPNVSTLSFHGSTYTSRYLAFKPFETTDRNHNKLDTMPTAEGLLFSKYDNPPYVPSSAANTIPFAYIGGKYMISGSGYLPTDIANASHLAIAKALQNAGLKVTTDIVGSANLISAAICEATKQQPASVCATSGVQAAAAQLAKSAG